MKISYQWLLKYLDASPAPEKIAEVLTACGLEVEGTEQVDAIPGGLKGIVVGEVLTCERHPNADKLSLTTVSVGVGEPLKIVCGAPNVAAGQKVLVATVGARLYPSAGEPFEIKKSKIRGEASEGMICAEDEIGLGESHAGIMVLDTSAVPGTPAAEHLKMESDVVFEIGLTPNRVDAASHIGVARDLVAAMNARNSSRLALKMPDLSQFQAASVPSPISVNVIHPEACPRYSGILVGGVTVKDSPDWLQNSLRAIGVKPINNIVDITNFVLHECGQPLHAFDASAIRENKIAVSRLAEGTKFITLDGLERTLTASDLMICSDENGALRPLCLAGVFGGQASGVSANTTSVFIESAYFAPSGIRRSSKHHALKTDAAFRYERGADPEITLFALKRAALLMQDIAGGRLESNLSDHYPVPVMPARVDFSLKRFNALCGTNIEAAQAKSILSDLAIAVQEQNAEHWLLEVPAFKPDVSREADVAEEILRIVGYDQIPLSDRLRAPVLVSPRPDREKLMHTIADQLAANGFLEIMTNSLRKEQHEQAVRLLNPLSEELAFMRTSLLFGGLDAIGYNQNRRQTDLRFFEYGRVYVRDENSTNKKGPAGFAEQLRLSVFMTGRKESEAWNAPSDKVDFFLLKGYIENLFARLGCQSEMQARVVEQEHFAETIGYFAGKKEVAVIGKLKQAILKKHDVQSETFFADIQVDNLLSLVGRKDLVFAEIPKFPEVRRDLSLELDRAVSYSDLEKISFETERKLLKKVNLFDVYQGDKIAQDKKSYALSFTLLDDTRTLTDKDVDKVMGKLTAAFESKLGATLRK